MGTYIPLAADPTNNYKNKLINMLRTIKAEVELGRHHKQRLYATGASPQNFRDHPKYTRGTSP